MTLAHVARPMVLASSLDAGRHEAVVACSPRYARFLSGQAWRSVPLESIDSRRFTEALARGRPVYDAAVLRDYVREDLRLIETLKPDLVIGDFRLSLSVSCRLAGVPCASVTNTYWSPYLEGLRDPLPVLPFTKFLPIPLAEALFRVASPFAFAQHCKPLNQVRREHGLASLGNDLRRVYTDADHVLYADVAGLFRTRPLPPNHHHLGPILWSPPIPAPGWWDRVPTEKPIVYVTLGSSGQAAILSKVLAILADMPVTVLASSAGETIPRPASANVFVADYLPGTEAAARSQLVICNGGSPTSQQALAAGVPVIGIASNMDQFLNMAALAKAGAGLLLRADRLSAGSLREAVEAALQVPTFRRAAAAFSQDFEGGATEARFRAWVDTGPRVDGAGTLRA